MKNVNELIPDYELRLVLEGLIEKEHERCLDTIEQVNKYGALTNAEDFAEELADYYRRRLKKLATIYQQLFSKDIYS